MCGEHDTHTSWCLWLVLRTDPVLYSHTYVGVVHDSQYDSLN